MTRIGFVATFLATVAASAVGAETIRLGDFTWENKDAKRYHVANIPIAGLKPGMRAEVTMWVDASGLSEKGVPEASLAWGSRTTGSGWAQGSSTVLIWNDKRIERDARGRRKFVCRTTVMPTDGVNPKLHFFAKCPATGKIVYSDITVTLFPRTYQLILSSTAYRDAAFDGEVRLAASFVTDPDAEPVGRLSGRFLFKDADGRETVRKPDRFTAESAEITVPVAALSPGRQNVRFELALDGRRLDVVAHPFERLARPVTRRVAFDRAGRTRVNGKPFFPIGMYWSENTLSLSNSLERYAAPGVFNCVQTYEKAMTPAILDRYWSKGLRVMASVKDIYIPGPDGLHVFCPKNLRTKAEETAYVTAVVNRCKDHPALLAWYTSDEMDGKFAHRLADRYALMRRLDPEHPVYVLAFLESTRALMRFCDVTGEDCYSICRRAVNPLHAERPGMGQVWIMADRADEIRRNTLDTKPLWQVTQAFKWQWDHKDRFECRFPTRRELAAQTWQQVAAGANGIFFYSYGQMCNATRDGRESELIEYFDETTVPVARELHDVEPILLADPGPAVKAKPARVRVRTWKKDGDVYVLVCNTHPERRTGTVAVDGAFASCEPVFGTGVSFENDRLTLDLKPIASAMVRLR